jgi:hypothetical protein
MTRHLHPLSLTFAWVLLASCAHVPAASRPYERPEDAEAIIAAWDAHGAFAAVTAACQATLERTRVILTDTTAEWCGLERAGCTHQTRTGFLGLGDLVPTIAMQRKRASPGLARHELLHVLTDCQDAPGLENGDPNHRDPRLWEVTWNPVTGKFTGTTGSIEERARALQTQAVGR